MKVTRIAQTVIDRTAMYEVTDEKFETWSVRNDKDSDVLAEFAGRACYQSWSRPNPATAHNADYIRSAVHEKGHESIAAHASVTYYITGVSRALTHEMIRSRFLAFSEVSQRYVDANQLGTVTPPALRDAPTYGEDPAADSREWYTEIVEVLIDKGLTRKQAREAARAVLPSMIETRIVVSGNLRAWRDFIKQRWSVHADAEIRELAGEILKDLRQVAPNTFADIPEEPYE
ncbi:FAD-dependent thymidylate synthase [Actinomadura sp. WMMB 499]|uniref:FAD-dependent thymidylate synthase n=1 Tax=Actinomadura sp. WMMB 499 TaxID=1219491 RepID=UPI001243EECE|nr:FAD-dependent thymidylate synthase [Actinomadura sp. WMMB 499]QFG25471.1 FAD-dependent thymidylate synthase [Actinomadura sp. WMMB 499]